MMKVLLRSLIFLSLSFLALSLPAQQKNISIYLVGDAGEPTLHANGIFPSIQSHHDANSRSIFIFLGDNVYPKGMPPQNHSERKLSEYVLQSQVDLANTFSAEAFIVPGNHDWERDGKHGWDRIKLQQQFIDSLKNPAIHFLPQEGCPGPVEVPLGDGATLIILDSQWFLHPWDKPEGDDSPCEMKRPEDVVLKLEEMLERHQHERVIVAAHHPIYTYGEHGGHFTLKDHIFPLTAFDSSKWYIPLPVVGSLYPLYRMTIGSRQDIAHPINKRYRTLVREVLEKFPGVLYVNGHEHALQYAYKDSVHYITSGSSVKTTDVKQKGYAKFVSDELGYVKLDIQDNGTTSIQYFETKKTDPVYQVNLGAVKKSDGADGQAKTFPSHVRVHASDRYTNTSPWRGENYRREWQQDLSVPVIRIDSLYGGLTPVQKGGGMQTLSLRLEDKKGNEYTLRSIEKFPEKAIPEILRKTFAQDLVQDQISAAHPYGAVVVPALAEAAGIYHTNPEVVFIPDDPALGIYQREFANTLALFEERPGGNAKDKPYFGNADKIISTDKVLERLKEDPDNKVDQTFVVRSRLFDLTIGDWDRHDDQWRWAVLKNKKKETYRPIPRDRDQAFFYSDGRLARFWSRRWILPKFEGFRDEVRWTPGFMFNARYFDRSFLNELTADQWTAQAKELQRALTDSVVENAIKGFPQEIFQHHGNDIIRKIKSRRDKLVQYASEHYAFLAKEVDVVGSDKKDWFTVSHLDNKDVLVSVAKVNKSGEKSGTYYERTFHPHETKEIRLFGLGGEDVFDFKGESKGAIKVRVIGGDGKDSLSNRSDLRVYLYDLKNDMEVSGHHVADRTSYNPDVNLYDRKAYRYSRMAPLVYGNLNNDDGIFIGGGFLLNKHSFRKQPYASQHLFLASFAPMTQSYNFKYDGRFMQVFGKWGIELDFDWKAPNFVNNFFGWGNESEFNNEIDEVPGLGLERPIDYYRIRLQQMDYQFKLSRQVGTFSRIKFGPAFQRVEIDDPNTFEARYIREYAASLDEPLIEVSKSFAGAVAQFDVDHRDHNILTTRGTLLSYRGAFMKGLDSDATDFTNHNASLSFYHTFSLPARVTFALRSGGGLNTGKYEIYQAQILDGKTELRGYRKTRFYGDKRFYTNSEVRIRLASFRSYLFPAHFGMNAFYDFGRVWYEDENGIDPTAPDGKSNKWHHGIGGGLWFTPFNMTVLSTELAHSQDGNMIYIRLGFLF